MRKYKAIIVDDEQSAQDVLLKLIQLYCPQIEIISLCSNLLDAVDKIKETKPDLVFLDIEMPNYAGYEIVSFFENIDFDIIFITAYDQYAIKAFEVSATDYVLKPINIDRLKAAIAKFEDNKKIQKIQKSYLALKENLGEPVLTKLIIPHLGEQKVIDISTIIGIEAKESYTFVYTSKDERFMVSKNLKHFENLLSENPIFLRSHKSWLININQIIDYSSSELLITLTTSLVTKLSKYKKLAFNEKFTGYKTD